MVILRCLGMKVINHLELTESFSCQKLVQKDPLSTEVVRWSLVFGNARWDMLRLEIDLYLVLVYNANVNQNLKTMVDAMTLK